MLAKIRCKDVDRLPIISSPSCFMKTLFIKSTIIAAYSSCVICNKDKIIQEFLGSLELLFKMERITHGVMFSLCFGIMFSSTVFNITPNLKVERLKRFYSYG